MLDRMVNSAVTNESPRKEQLVEAALSIMVGGGVSALRTRDVARRVGVNHALIHYYFPAKDDLIQAVLERVKAEIDSFQQNVIGEEATAGLSRREVLQRHFRNLVSFISEAPETALITMELTLRAEHEL